MKSQILDKNSLKMTKNDKNLKKMCQKRAPGTFLARSISGF